MGNAIPTARLEEILAGCRDVTPGPWRLEVEREGYMDLTGKSWHAFAKIVSRVFQANGPGVTKAYPENAAHIARLDPQTVSAIITELLDRRARSSLLDVAGLADLEKLPPGAFWLLSKGKLSEREPMFGFQVLFDSDEIIASGEGDTAEAAIQSALQAISASRTGGDPT